MDRQVRLLPATPLEELVACACEKMGARSEDAAHVAASLVWR